MKLLEDDLARRTEARESERLATRLRLQAALSELLPRGSRVWVYGSLVKPNRYRDGSDIDLALEAEPTGMSLYLFMSLLSDKTGRPVDVSLLGETRLREAIMREGELWTA